MVAAVIKDKRKCVKMDKIADISVFERLNSLSGHSDISVFNVETEKYDKKIAKIIEKVRLYRNGDDDLYADEDDLRTAEDNIAQAVRESAVDIAKTMIKENPTFTTIADFEDAIDEMGNRLFLSFDPHQSTCVADCNYLCSIDASYGEQDIFHWNEDNLPETIFDKACDELERMLTKKENRRDVQVG